MASRVIESHGCSFYIQGDGFNRSSAEGDFERICDQIEGRLDAMHPTKVRDLHTRPVDEEPGELQQIADTCCADVVRGWHNPNAAFVSISAYE